MKSHLPHMPRISQPARLLQLLKLSGVPYILWLRAWRTRIRLLRTHNLQTRFRGTSPGTVFAFVSVLISTSIITGCDKASSISYAKDVNPILQKHCTECHLSGGEGEAKSGFNLGTYAGLMKGTKFGPVIRPGDSLSSTLVVLVEGRADPSLKMPHGDRPPLSREEIKSIRAWIDQGAKNN